MAQHQEPATWSEMILDELSMMKGFLSFEDPEQIPQQSEPNEELQYFLMSDELGHSGSHNKSRIGGRDPPGKSRPVNSQSFDTDASSMRAHPPQQTRGNSFDTDTVRAVAPSKHTFPSMVAVPPSPKN